MTCDLSRVSLWVTIILGGYAIIQSWMYNRDSEKISKDIKYMLVEQIKLLNETQRDIRTAAKKPETLDLGKDEIELHKLCKFRKRDIDRIMDKINHLSIKSRFLKDIEAFLKSNDTECRHNFWGKAESDEEINIEELYAILLEYNVMLSIIYH